MTNNDDQNNEIMNILCSLSHEFEQVGRHCYSQKQNVLEMKLF